MRVIAIPPVLRSGMLQGLGAVASVLLGVVLARRLGPDGSGYVAGYRNIGDLFAVVATLGLPQAFVFFMTSRSLSHRALGRFCVQTIAAVSATLIMGLVVYAAFAPAGPDWSLIWVMLGGLGIVIYLLARGILLGKAISISFDLVSVSPNILALLACVAWPLANSADLLRCIALANIFAGVVAGGACLRAIWATPDISGTHTHVTFADIVAMCAYGFWVWLPQVLGMGMVFVTYRALGFSGERDQAIGLFSIALVIYNIVQGPLGLFVPALMRHWSGRNSGDSDMAREYGFATGIGNLFLIAACVAFLLVGHVMIALVFGAAFAGAWGAISCLLVAAIAGYHMRLMTSMLYAHGQPRSVARGYVIRFAITAMTIPMLYYLRLDAVRATELMAVAWAVADWCCCLDMGLSLRRVTAIPWRDIFGTYFRWRPGSR